MRIAFLYDRIFPHSIGGVEHRNLELGKALVARGHEVVLGGPAARSYRVEGVQIVPCPESAPWTGPHRLQGVLPWIGALLQFPTEEFDVVETANIPTGHLLPLDHRCRMTNTPLIVTWHEFWGAYWDRWGSRLLAPVFRSLERVGARAGTVVCAVSQLTADRVKGARNQPVPVVPNGVDIDRITPEDGHDVADSSKLVFAGRLIREKRLDLILEALTLLRARRPELRLTLIGDGPDRSRLRALATELSLEPVVEFKRARTSIEDVWQEIAGSVLAVQPSAREGFGMFPLEAMALGLPVVFCRSPDSAVGEIVRHGREGLGVESRPEDLAKAIEKLLNDRDLRRSLSRNAKRRASEFAWKNVAERFESLATRLLGSESSRPHGDNL